MELTMSLRNKLLISFTAICFLVISLLGLNSFMAREQGGHVQRLLAIHHHYAALLNLKNAVNRQLSEAQDIFIYGKTVDDKSFQETAAQVGTEMQRLQAAMDLTEALPLTSGGDTIDSGKSLMVKLQHDYEDLYRELVLMTMLIKSGRKAKAQEHFQTEISGRFTNFFSKIDGWLVEKKEQLSLTEGGFVSINERHNRTSLIALVAIMAIVLFFSGVFVYLLGPRLREMQRGTERISKGDFSKPVRVEGNDEFSRLSLAMNQMMTDLAVSRKKLLEQSYYSGMADMVSGTLHNLRNSLAPIVVELEEQKRAMTDLSLDRMQQACAELRGNALDKERSADLVEYLCLSLAQLDESIGETVKRMASTRNKVDVVEKVLNQHSHLARMERPLETVVLAEAVHDCLGLVPQEAMETISVLVDESVTAIAPVISQRIVLVQVLANLVSNGLESILRSGSTVGQVVIDAAETFEGERRQVHVRVTDTGEGIPADMLDRIFERGISAKGVGSGLGLHWCANATASLAGRLFAESLGLGQGATLHLILTTDFPKA